MDVVHGRHGVRVHASGVEAVGAIGVAAVFPAAFLSPAMGYVIDRFPRERVLAAMLALRFVSLIAAVVSAAFFPSVGVLVAVAVAEGVASLFVRPTTAALLPSVTRRPEDLVRAHAALGFADNIGVLVGPVSGGFILAGTTPVIAFATAAALAFFSLRRDGQSAGGSYWCRRTDRLSRSAARTHRGHQGRTRRRRTRCALGRSRDRVGVRRLGRRRGVHRAARDRPAPVGRGRNRPADGVHRRRRVGRRCGARA